MEGIIFLLVILVIVVFGWMKISGWARSANLEAELQQQKAELQQQKAELQQKQQAYTKALIALRAKPTIPSLHEQAFHRGRIYAAATRENKAVTLFDETALANDIRAVTANATQTTVPVAALNSATAPATSFDDRINTLLKLKASGLITDAEFDHKRKEMLDSI
jgi:hypothetical protein